MTRLAKLAAAGLIAALALPAPAAPETYTVEPTHTFPRFSYSHFGMSTQLSRFNKTSGTVTLDREARTGAVDITIDMTSVDTGYETFDGHIQGEDFLDTANHPTATFKSTRVSFEGDTPASIDGELTIKGITRPVTLKITNFKTMPHPIVNKPAIGADATTVVKRTDFNAGKYAPDVGDEVTITVSLEAIRE